MINNPLIMDSLDLLEEKFPTDYKKNKENFDALGYLRQARVTFLLEQNVSATDIVAIYKKTLELEKDPDIHTTYEAIISATEAICPQVSMEVFKAIGL